MVRKGLGRGLSSLLGERSPVEREETDERAEIRPSEDSHGHLARGLHDLPVGAIDSNPFQPRLEMDLAQLEELAQSIRRQGLLEPLLVRRHPSVSGRYQLIAGERRLRASQIAELEQVPAQVREASEAEMLEIALVENVQRENLNPIEEAKGYRLMLDGTLPGSVPLTQEELAERVGKSRPVIANLLRLLELPEEVQVSIQSGQLSQGHGKVLAGLPTDRLSAAWRYAVQHQVSVRALEEYVKKGPHTSTPSERSPRGKVRPQAGEGPPPDPHWTAIEEALHERLRTKVQVRRGADGSGVIEVSFFNNEDLDRLLECLDIEL